MIRKGEKLRNKETGKLYKVTRLQDEMVLLESMDGQGELLLSRMDLKTMCRKTLVTRIYNFARILILIISITSGLLAFYFLYLTISNRGGGDAFEAHGITVLMFLSIAIYLPLLFYGGVWVYRGIVWICKKF